MFNVVDVIGKEKMLKESCFVLGVSGYTFCFFFVFKTTVDKQFDEMKKRLENEAVIDEE